ncbi:hypothetical protein KY284_026276 [Solanum tuberosum]|nr:hypothetical protein KY284_026276 [Solanum tuberosum]
MPIHPDPPPSRRSPPITDRRHATPTPRRLPRPQPPTVAAAEDVAAAAEEVTPSSRRSRTSIPPAPPPFRPAPPPSRPAPPSPAFLVKATEEAQHVKKLIQDYFASFIKVGDKVGASKFLKFKTFRARQLRKLNI